jgi:hypothetical protein
MPILGPFLLCKRARDLGDRKRLVVRVESMRSANTPNVCHKRSSVAH